MDGFFVGQVGRERRHPPAGFVPRGWQHEFMQSFQMKASSHPCWDRNADPFRYMLVAGVGSGKTDAAALAAMFLINRGVAQRVTYVCPNRAIMPGVQKSFARFGINLFVYDGDRSHGEPSDSDGNIVSYQSVCKRPERHRRFCYRPTLVIFDEIHHLGEGNEWGKKAKQAFGADAIAILSLSGTPFRSDKEAIPFVDPMPSDGEPEGLVRFRADYNYSLGNAVADGVCRRPVFTWSLSHIQYTPASGEQKVYTFEDDTSDETASILLRGAVCPGAQSRRQHLMDSLTECLSDRRRVIIFTGGDSKSDILAQRDAAEFLPAELIELAKTEELKPFGITASDIVSIVSDDNESATKLATFEASAARILVSVNKVSEGVNIPSLAAAIFLSSSTAPLMTIQRIGRVLRGVEQFGQAKIFMFGDRRYRMIAKQIEDEIDEWESLRKKVRPTIDEPRPPGEFKRPTAIGLDKFDGGMTTKGREYSQKQRDEARSLMRLRRYPNTPGYEEMALDILFGPSNQEARADA